MQGNEFVVRIVVGFNTMGLWRLTKGMVIHIRGLPLEYVTHRRVTKNHHRYKIERLHLVGGYVEPIDSLWR